jgi:DNA-binding LacI/PurR family transcriptional regulator
LGERTAAIVLDLVAAKQIAAKTVLIEPRLIIRESSIRNGT